MIEIKIIQCKVHLCILDASPVDGFPVNPLARSRARELDREHNGSGRPPASFPRGQNGAADGGGRFGGGERNRRMGGDDIEFRCGS